LYAFLAAAVLAAVLAAAAPAARADDRGAATAVISAQLKLLDEQLALNKCLKASPTRNTPCIVRAARRLAAVAGSHRAHHTSPTAKRQIGVIRSSLDGNEIACVRTVANRELSIQTLWRRGALALTRNERKKAKSLFLQAAKLLLEQRQIQPRCFADVLTTPP
jgi:hypothetical protein